MRYLYHTQCIMTDDSFCRDIATSFPSFIMREEADDADIGESFINANNGLSLN